MSNRRGNDLERAAYWFYRESGYDVIASKASRGAADLWAVRCDGPCPTLVFVQCGPKGASQLELLVAMAHRNRGYAVHVRRPERGEEPHYRHRSYGSLVARVVGRFNRHEEETPN